MATIRITRNNGQCYESAVSKDGISFTGKAFEEIVNNLAKSVKLQLVSARKRAEEKN